ncbi:MAG: extracellular solute-binding protein [Clostridia bacterium]|nr:extracellular solute-binding protein [Clostridia bacterium]
MKKVLALVLAAMMLLVCCGALAEAPEGYPAVVEGIDFGGADVTIYDYWSGEGARKTDPTEEEQLQYDYRDWINATYNVNLSQKQDGDWGSNATQMTNFTTSPDGSLRLYIIEPGSVASLVSGGVVAPVSDKYVDLQSAKWNSAERDFMTIGGKIYGLYSGNSEPRGCLYFNKRVLQEAGIDWNTIYDLQKEGKWTWAAFEEMLKTITRDTDNDGVNDIYGILGSGDDMYVCAVFSNGGSFFDFDADGKLQPTMNSDATISALSWGKDLQAKYWAPTPEGANWDWYKDAWKQGYCGFYMYQTYGGFNDNSEMADMKDEWGCVAFPVPNEGDTYITVVSDNITLIPACYDEETVAKLTFLYDLWTNDTPGVETEGNWIGNKYNYTDERAVDETYAMLREPEHARVNKTLYLGTQNDVLGNSLLWSLGGSTPAELIEAGMPAWQALCDTFNNK